MKQRQQIEFQLRTNGEVSDVWAKNNYIWRLAAIIGNLRKDGWDIETIYKEKNGKREKTATYLLRGLPEKKWAESTKYQVLPKGTQKTPQNESRAVSMVKLEEKLSRYRL